MTLFELNAFYCSETENWTFTFWCCYSLFWLTELIITLPIYRKVLVFHGVYSKPSESWDYLWGLNCWDGFVEVEVWLVRDRQKTKEFISFFNRWYDCRIKYANSKLKTPLDLSSLYRVCRQLKLTGHIAWKPHF